MKSVNLFDQDSVDKALKEIAAADIPDPMVMQTSWLPLDRAGEFCPRELMEVEPGRLEFPVSLFAKGTYVGLILFGTFSSVLVPRYRLAEGNFFHWKTAVMVLFAVLVAAAGAFLLVRRTKHIVFDLGRGVFWKGNSDADAGSKEAFCRFKDIHALQLISVKNCASSGSGAYFSFELNLVLSNGKRISVINHGDRDRLSRHSTVIGQRLGKPVWNVIDRTTDFYGSVQGKNRF